MRRASSGWFSKKIGGIACLHQSRTGSINGNLHELVIIIFLCWHDPFLDIDYSLPILNTRLLAFPNLLELEKKGIPDPGGTRKCIHEQCRVGRERQKNARHSGPGGDGQAFSSTTVVSKGSSDLLMNSMSP